MHHWIEQWVEQVAMHSSWLYINKFLVLILQSFLLLSNFFTLKRGSFSCNLIFFPAPRIINANTQSWVDFLFVHVVHLLVVFWFYSWSGIVFLFHSFLFGLVLYVVFCYRCFCSWVVSLRNKTKPSNNNTW